MVGPIRNIPNSELRLSDIPAPDACWNLINKFAHTFNGYEEAGSFDKCAEVALSGNPQTLSELRMCLFFSARSARHGGGDSEHARAARTRHAHSLLKRIRRKVERGEIGQLELPL